jgi:isochorismate hydrolase
VPAEVRPLLDACSAACADQHQGSMTNIFPRIGRVRSTDEILNAL